jgi:serine/threonine protein phosphatase 1
MMVYRMLRRLFTKANQQQCPRGPAGSRAYAIGDVHGRHDLLLQLLDLIEADHRSRPAAKTYLVFLGDLVDRGPNSKGVLDHLIQNTPAFGRTIFLKGNHEEFFLGALDGDLNKLQSWLAYGGAECVESYGISGGWLINASPPDILARLGRDVPKSHVDFLQNMADTFRFGDYLFVHAGIRPGIPLDQQTGKDLRWIREGFLDDTTCHGVTVVHGHTIVETVQEHSNRIAIDTGAYRTGVLTAIGLEGTNRWLVQAKQVGD